MSRTLDTITEQENPFGFCNVQRPNLFQMIDLLTENTNLKARDLMRYSQTELTDVFYINFLNWSGWITANTPITPDRLYDFCNTKLNSGQLGLARQNGQKPVYVRWIKCLEENELNYFREFEVKEEYGDDYKADREKWVNTAIYFLMHPGELKPCERPRPALSYEIAKEWVENIDPRTLAEYHADKCCNNPEMFVRRNKHIAVYEDYHPVGLYTGALKRAHGNLGGGIRALFSHVDSEVAAAVD